MAAPKTKSKPKPRRKITRTNIMLDDVLIKRAMQRAGVKTKREAVQAALELFTQSQDSFAELLAACGSGLIADGYDPKAPYGGFPPAVGSDK